MKGKSNLIAMTLLIITISISACQPAASPQATMLEPPERILFIGDSFTMRNLGLESHMPGLVTSAYPDLAIKTLSLAKPGFPLSKHWEDQGALKPIQGGSWDVVVLQEDTTGWERVWAPDLARDSDEINQDSAEIVQTFYEYTRKFTEEINQAGTQTVLMMPWEFQATELEMTTEEIAQVYNNIGKELGIKVAPVGFAWQQSLEERPSLTLYHADSSYPALRRFPNIAGTYLSLCVLYATIYEQNPTGLTYQPADLIANVDSLKHQWEEWQLTEDEVAFLQRIAWETVQEYQSNE